MILSKYRTNTGQGILEFFTQLAVSDKNPLGSRLSASKLPSVSKKSSDVKTILKDIMEDPNNAAVHEIFFNEKNRINLYNDYDLICQYIPQLSQALDTYVDSIISPDDFTKISLNYYYNDTIYTDAKDVTIRSNIRNLIEMYDFDKYATERIVKKTLKYGDCFVAALPYKDEFERFLSEDAEFNFDPEMLIPDQSKYNLSEDTVSLTDEDVLAINEAFGLSEDKALSGDTLKKDLIDCLNENLEICDSSILMEEVFTTTKDFFKKNSKFLDDYKDSDGSLLVSAEDELESQSIILGKEAKKRYIDQVNASQNEKRKKLSKKNKGKKVKVAGSYFKILDPRRIVKINVGPTVFGYFYVDKATNTDYNPTMITKNAFANASIGGGIPSAGAIDVQINDGSIDQTFNMDAKLRVINNLFCRNISKMLDKKFIEKNKQFKNLMYELLKNDYIFKKRVRIIFLTPDEVEHFKIGGEDDYGESIFKDILFTAKIYLSVLTTQLMMKVSRSADHRAFYIETGLSEDVEQTIQSFVRDLKAKEVKLKDMQSIDTIFNNIGQFIDYFIPVVNGEKAVDIDTIQGMNVEMDNDFLDYLRKSMMSGLGIPSNYLNYNDEVEFAKSLSMMNSKYIRRVIMFQVPIGKSLTSLFRKLYRNEYGLFLKEAEKRKFEEILECIEIKLPSPGSLNMSNLSEQISQGQQLAEYIVTTILGQNFDSASEDSGAIKDKAMLAVTKDLLTSIDWSKYEEIIEKSKSDYVETKLENSDNQEDEEEMMENEEDLTEDEETSDEYSEEEVESDEDMEEPTEEDESVEESSEEEEPEATEELEDDTDKEDNQEEPSEDEEGEDFDDIV